MGAGRVFPRRSTPGHPPSPGPRPIARTAGRGHAVCRAPMVSFWTRGPDDTRKGVRRRKDVGTQRGSVHAVSRAGRMSAFVLVHGSSHGGWCWDRVVPLLQQAGHEVAAPDLPAHGDDLTLAAEATLEGYLDRVTAVLDGLSGPAVLVGHSLGGAVISGVTERRPEKVGLLVYLTAYLLPDGRSVLEAAQADEESTTLPNSDLDAERGVGMLRADAAKDVFYGDCSEEDARWAIERLTPEPLAPLATPVSISEANFGRARRTYIECLQDRAVGPATQRQMHTEMPCEKVISMDTSHSPFLSRPRELAGHLDSLARL